MQGSEKHHIGLIDLLYGLAIAAGFENAIVAHGSILIVSSPPLYLIFGALLLALSDWSVYHYIASRKPYEGILRFIFDLMFPLLLFIIFLELENPDMRGFSFLVLVYFIASLFYILMLGKAMPVKRLPLWIVSVIGILCAGMGFIQAFEVPPGPKWEFFVSAAISIWALFNGLMMRWQFRGQRKHWLFSIE